MMSTKDLWEVVEPVCQSRGIELVNLEKKAERGGSVLRVVIDKELEHKEGPEQVSPADTKATGPSVSAETNQPIMTQPLTLVQLEERQLEGGLQPTGSAVSLQDCEEITRDVSAVLDELDQDWDSYRLEVSSPGLNRPLVKLNDFVRFSGHEVKVETLEPLHERKRFTGRLDGVSEGQVELTVDGEQFRIPHDVIKKAHVVYPF